MICTWAHMLRIVKRTKQLLTKYRNAANRLNTSVVRLRVVVGWGWGRGSRFGAPVRCRRDEDDEVGDKADTICTLKIQIGADIRKS